MKVEWSPRSKTEQANVLEYLERQWGSKYVIRFLDLLEEKVERIKENPNYYEVFEKERNIRRCVIHRNVSLYYRVWNEKIEILSVWGNAQDPLHRHL